MTEGKLNLTLPEKPKSDGKEFRKFLVKHFMSQDKSLTTLEGERLASRFLTEIGVDFIEWPYRNDYVIYHRLMSIFFFEAGDSRGDKAVVDVI